MRPPEYDELQPPEYDELSAPAIFGLRAKLPAGEVGGKEPPKPARRLGPWGDEPPPAKTEVAGGCER